MSERRVINIADVPMNLILGGRRFAAQAGLAGPEIGSTGIGCSVFDVPPGMSACPFHRHHATHELFFVLEGEGETRLDEARLPIRPGDLIAAPAGKEAHQIVNTGTTNLRYLAFSAEGPADIVEYPDSSKLMIEAGTWPNRSIELLGRLAPAEYYDGEEA